MVPRQNAGSSPSGSWSHRERPASPTGSPSSLRTTGRDAPHPVLWQSGSFFGVRPNRSRVRCLVETLTRPRRPASHCAHCWVKVASGTEATCACSRPPPLIGTGVHCAGATVPMPCWCTGGTTGESWMGRSGRTQRRWPRLVHGHRQRSAGASSPQCATKACLLKTALG